MDTKADNVELHPELMGVASLYSLLRHNSSQRQQMAIGMQGQALVLSRGGDKNAIVSGTDRHFKNHVIDVRTESDVEIVKLIDKYGKKAGSISFDYNPTTTVICRNQDTNEFDIINVDRFVNKDQSFGYELKPTNNLDDLSVGQYFPKNTSFMTSPNVDEDGDYNYGVEVMTALISIPAVIEDGVRVTKQFCEKIKTKSIKKVVINLGKKGFPINYFGNERNYKFMPDIGETVGDDGILAITRRYSEDLAVCQMTDGALRKPDFFFDDPVYVEPNSRILDIKVTKQSKVDTVPDTMLTQAHKYRDAQHSYYRSIIGEYNRLVKEYGDELRISNKFHQLLVTAMGEIYENNVKGAITKTYRNVPIDEWRIEVTYSYEHLPTIGYKLTDQSGAKAVIVDIIDEKDTMFDERGHKVELYYDDKSTIKRMNLARLYEKYIKSASLHLQEDFKEYLDIPIDSKVDREAMTSILFSRDIDKIGECFDKLMGYYKLVAPIQYDMVVELHRKGGDAYMVEHMASQLSGHNIRLYMPTDNPVDSVKMVQAVEEYVKPLYKPCYFRKRDGTIGKTKNPIRISQLYMTILEKTGGLWSAVSSSKRNHFGVPSKRNNFDRNGDPIKKNPTRAIGEAEQRNKSAHLPMGVAADMIDRSTNPRVHREVCRSIVTADDPCDIQLNVDRKLYPIGNGRIQAFVKHIIECDGQEMYRENLDIEDPDKL